MCDYPNNLTYGFLEGGTISYINRVDLYNYYIYYSILLVFIIILLLSSILFNYGKGNIHLNIDINKHNMIEIGYTLLPCILIIIIFLPSIKLLYIVDSLGYITTNLCIIGYQ
jgi:heme/copper-type cytochrome/quinol oxidase subunit 2